MMKKIFSLAWWLPVVGVMLAGAGCSSPKKAPAVAGVDRTSSAERPAAAPAATEKQGAILSIDSRFLNQDSLHTRIYMVINARKGNELMPPREFASAYNLNYVIYSDYGSRDRLGYGNVPLQEADVRAAGDRLVLDFEVKKPKKESGLMLIEITENITMKKLLNDLPIRFSTDRVSDKVGLFSGDGHFFLQRNFVKKGEPVQLKELSGQPRRLYGYYYNHDFEPAGSPMNTSPRPASRSLKVDSAFTVSSAAPLIFEKEGLYFFLSDTAQAEGIGFVVVDERYPKITYPERLLPPLMYMSTNAEIREIQAAKDFKKSLDKYWLTLMAGNQELARQTISNYYKRVEEANQLFTTYKEGWKTDKGMIYIILGNPDKVQRGKDREVWEYSRRANATNINFTFNRRTNQFVYDHYELVRYQEYQPIWYPLVESWRTGAIR